MFERTKSKIITKLILLFNIIFTISNIMISGVAGAEGEKSNNSSISQSYKSTVSQTSQDVFGLEYLKNLLFDEAVLFTMFSAIALLIALLGAAIIIGKRH